MTHIWQKENPRIQFLWKYEKKIRSDNWNCERRRCIYSFVTKWQRHLKFMNLFAHKRQYKTATCVISHFMFEIFLKPKHAWTSRYLCAELYEQNTSRENCSPIRLKSNVYTFNTWLWKTFKWKKTQLTFPLLYAWFTQTFVFQYSLEPLLKRYNFINTGRWHEYTWREKLLKYCIYTYSFSIGPIITLPRKVDV